MPNKQQIKENKSDAKAKCTHPTIQPISALTLSPYLRYKLGDSDVILSTILTASMFEVYSVAAM